MGLFPQILDKLHSTFKLVKEFCLPVGVVQNFGVVDSAWKFVFLKLRVT